MNKNLILIGLAALLLIIGSTAAYSLLNSDSVDCEDKYDEIIEESTSVEDLPEECEPLPENVEQELGVEFI